MDGQLRTESLIEGLVRVKDVRYEAVENFRPLEIDRMPGLGNRFAFRSWNKIREGRAPALEAVALSCLGKRVFNAAKPHQPTTVTVRSHRPTS